MFYIHCLKVRCLVIIALCYLWDVILKALLIYLLQTAFWTVILLSIGLVLLFSGVDIEPFRYAGF